MHLAESVFDLDLIITASLCLDYQENKQRFDLYNFDPNKQNI